MKRYRIEAWTRPKDEHSRLRGADFSADFEACGLAETMDPAGFGGRFLAAVAEEKDPHEVRIVEVADG